MTHRIMLVVALAACGKSPDDKPKPAASVARIDATVPAPPIAIDATPAVSAAPPVDAAAPAAASKAAFPELFDMRRRWIFEVVHGASLATLAPVKRAPRVFGYLGAPKTSDGVEYVWLSTRPDSNQKGVDFSLAPNVSFGIAFDDDGIRHLAAIGATARANDKANIRGFSFPNTVDGTAKVKRDVQFGTIEIDIKREKLAIAGKRQDVLIARAKNFDSRHNDTWHETYAYAPALGPALLCPNHGARDFDCLRLVATDERACVTLSTKLCAGKDASVCAKVLEALQTDPNGERRLDTNSERHCMETLTSADKVEQARATLLPP